MVGGADVICNQCTAVCPDCGGMDKRKDKGGRVRGDFFFIPVSPRGRPSVLESMKLIDTKDAVGSVLAHDITQIIRGVTKDAVFRKGHIVREEDIPVLLSVGKDHLYVWENDPDMLHENDAADILRQICQGERMHPGDVKEGKIELIADEGGFFTVDTERLRIINSLGEMMIATIPSGIRVEKGQKLCGTRIIPLVIEKEKMEKAKEAVGPEPLLHITPFRKMNYGVVTTGNEVFYGRIKDTFTPVIEDKMREFDSTMTAHTTSDDNPDHILSAIKAMIDDRSIDMIICTGGMSVDPDDKTPLAIRNTGAEIVSYGAPVLPGAMFLMAYLPDGRPIVGLPGCVMYAGRTIFDLVLPRIMAGVRITKEYLAGLGEGGLCLSCPVCHFPFCTFGRGR